MNRNQFIKSLFLVGISSVNSIHATEKKNKIKRYLSFKEPYRADSLYDYYNLYTNSIRAQPRNYQDIFSTYGQMNPSVYDNYSFLSNYNPNYEYLFQKDYFKDLNTHYELFHPFYYPINSIEWGNNVIVPFYKYDPNPYYFNGYNPVGYVGGPHLMSLGLVADRLNLMGSPILASRLCLPTNTVQQGGFSFLENSISKYNTPSGQIETQYHTNGFGRGEIRGEITNFETNEQTDFNIEVSY